MIQVRISRQAQYRKLDALELFYSDRGIQRIRRWKQNYGFKPNAIALEDLHAGEFVTVDGNGYTIIAEIRNHRAPDDWPWPTKYSH